MSADFLLELLSEEIPARMQEKACADLARLFGEELAKSGIAAAAIETYATPRRLALIARGLPLATEAQREERRGPRADAPEQALAGFLKSTGLTRDRLEERDDAKGRFLYAVVEQPGRATADVLAAAIPAIVRAFPWPKSMRWGDGSLRWVRPLQGIVALLGDDVVSFEINGIVSGAATLGHRFHHPGQITIGNADDYADKLRMCHVILDPAERRGIIRDAAAQLAADAGLTVVPDEGLVAENAGLTEWPVPLLGRFDPAFLEVPREVIQLTMRTNQKYFALTRADGSLASNFICTANIEAADGGAAIAAGNARVLSARLSDARFFWEQDLKTPLAEQAKKLDQIVFHEKRGTLAERAVRVANLAADWLPEHLGWPEEKARREQPILRNIAKLAKADLVSGMVGEFPELQGIMGAYYADREGLEIGAAIRDHYKPLGPSDGLPVDENGTVVALADRADSLHSFFLVGERPTGSRDPYATRRAALGLIRLIVENQLRISLRSLFRAADFERSAEPQGIVGPDPTEDLVEFVIDRLKVQQREAGVRHDLIDAVFALGGEDDLVRMLERVKALQAFVSSEEGANLLAGYKRAANILRKEAAPSIAASPSTSLGTDGAGGGYALEPAESDLLAALKSVEPRAAAAIASEDFAAAMAALAQLRAPIDRFFEQVTVNDPDPAKRAARLAMLARIRDAVHRVADFSRIEG